MGRLNLADVEDLVELLRAGGIRSVDLDPARITLPGVWVNVRRIALDLLAGSTIGLELVVLAPDLDPLRTMTTLEELTDQLLDVLEALELGGPAGDLEASVASLPGHSAPLPCLVVPYDLTTTTEPE